MRIKIIKEIPVEQELKPKVGEVYEVKGDLQNTMYKSFRGYVIEVNKKEVGILSNECEVIYDENI
jgi:hypothetical protein